MNNHEIPASEESEREQAGIFAILREINRPEETLPFVADLDANGLHWYVMPDAVVVRNSIFLNPVGDTAGILACYRYMVDSFPPEPAHQTFLIRSPEEEITIPPGYAPVAEPMPLTRWTADTRDVPLLPLRMNGHAYIQINSTARDAEEIGFWFDAFHAPSSLYRWAAERSPGGLVYAAVLKNGYPVAFCGTGSLSTRWHTAMIEAVHIDTEQADRNTEAVLVAALSRHLLQEHGITDVGMTLNPQNGNPGWEAIGFTPYAVPLLTLGVVRSPSEA